MVLSCAQVKDLEEELARCKQEKISEGPKGEEADAGDLARLRKENEELKAELKQTKESLDR